MIYEIRNRKSQIRVAFVLLEQLGIKHYLRIIMRIKLSKIKRKKIQTRISNVNLIRFVLPCLPILIQGRNRRTEATFPLNLFIYLFFVLLVFLL